MNTDKQKQNRSVTVSITGNYNTDTGWRYKFSYWNFITNPPSYTRGGGGDKKKETKFPFFDIFTPISF